MNTVIRKIGNSEGVIIPKEMLQEQGLSAGDALEIVRTPDGLKLVKADSEFAQQMRYAREFMDKYRDALAMLAK